MIERDLLLLQQRPHRTLLIQQQLWARKQRFAREIRLARRLL
jgi:hypothetical protein